MTDTPRDPGESAVDDADAGAPAPADEGAASPASEGPTIADAASESSEAAAADPNIRRWDELLADPPAGDHHLGRLGGYAAGARARRIMAIVGVITVILSVIGAYALITYLQSRKAIPIHNAPLPEGTDASGRSRTLAWSSGKARLALTRAPPGADVIELPDREIRLADGCDAAQIKVEVANGKTVSIKVLYGEVVQVQRE